MAKKKADNQTESNPHKPQHKIHHHQPMDDAASEKVDNLKALNALLLKETVERRQQVDSLVQSNSYLESELNRSVMDNASFQSEMNALTEKAVLLEIEKGLVLFFVTAQVNQLAVERLDSLKDRIGSLEGDLKKVLVEKNVIEKSWKEKESEIGDLNRRLDELLAEINEERAHSTRARDEIRVQLDAQIQEVNELRLKVAKAENNCDRLMKNNAASERRIESIMKEKDVLQMDLVETNGLVDELQRNIAELLEQKKAIGDEKITQEIKNDELQTSVVELKQFVESMRIQKETLLENFADLEKKYVVSSKNEVEMKMEINGLVEEKKETERHIERLAKENSLVTKDLEDAMKELEKQKLTFEQIVQEKTEMENTNIQRESEIVQMNEQLSIFKDMISSLEMSRVNQNEKVKQLEVELGSYKSSFDQATIERNEALELLNKEKTITYDFKQKITGMEEKMEYLHEKLAKMTTENGKHLGEKNQLENRCAELVKEVAFLEAKLAETRIEFDGKLGVAEANSNRVLNILKKTLLVCDGNSDVDQENGVEEGIREHIAEVEAIKRAFKDNESRVEEVKRQLELVKSSAAEARKEKSFWTMVSSATTLLAAAASVAYVARAH